VAAAHPPNHRPLISGSVRWRDAWEGVPVNDCHVDGTARGLFLCEKC
jgi:hypothetical protein